MLYSQWKLQPSMDLLHCGIDCLHSICMAVCPTNVWCVLNSVDVSVNSSFVHDGTTIVGNEAITFVLFIIGLCALT